MSRNLNEADQTAMTLSTSSTSSLITLTAIFPVSGLGKARLTVLYSDVHASSSISALRTRLRRAHGSLPPVK